MFIIFNTKAQALNYVKRSKGYNYDDGCGCCWSYGKIFIDGRKVVQSNIASSRGIISASATVIGRIKGR